MDFGALSASERRFAAPAVAVSVVAFALQPPPGVAVGDEAALSAGASIWLPLVRRTREPFRGRWALPGGPTQWNETLSDTALRSARSAVSGDPAYLEQLYSFGSVERSAEAQRLVTIAYWALYAEAAAQQAVAEATPAREAPPRPRRWDDPDPALSAPTRSERPEPEGDRGVAWFAADALPPLAFDHQEIVAHALGRLRSKAEYEHVAHRFLGGSFTLAQLRGVHEAIQGRPTDPANFRRQALARGSLVETGETLAGASHRPAKLYRFAGE